MEFELNSEAGGEWMFGKFCYWANNEMLGYYDIGTSLRDVLFQIQYVIKCCGNRYFTDCSISATELFNYMNKCIYGDGGAYDECKLVEVPARFEITFPIDIFDCGVKAFLFDCLHDSSRIIYSIGNGAIKELKVGRGEFDSAIIKFY